MAAVVTSPRSLIPWWTAIEYRGALQLTRKSIDDFKVPDAAHELCGAAIYHGHSRPTRTLIPKRRACGTKSLPLPHSFRKHDTCQLEPFQILQYTSGYHGSAFTLDNRGGQPRGPGKGAHEPAGKQATRLSGLHPGLPISHA